MGPYTMEARHAGLAQVQAHQEEINAAALVQGRPLIDLINTEEHQRILELIAANTWPEKWRGLEVRGDLLMRQERGFRRYSTIPDRRSITHGQRTSPK